MAVFHPSDYIVPNSLQEVISILKTHGDKAKILAGGTTIHELASRGMIPQVQVLVDVEKLDLNYIHETESEIKIGATTTITQALGSELFSLLKLPNDLGAIAESLNAIHPDQVRNVATIGGEICSGIPFLDLPPALVALDASAAAEGPQGTRILPLVDFFEDFFLTKLKSEEIVTEVRIPKPNPHSGSAFRKFARTGNDWALVNLATFINIDGSGKCKECRIVAGAVGRTPMRLAKAEETLRGKKPDSEVLERTAQAVYSELRPTSGLDAPSSYKKELARVLARETLTESIEAAHR